LLATLSVASGESVVEENVFENRFHTANELEKMGAHINVVGRQCHISGVEKLHGAVVIVPDLRGGAALTQAGLMADGKTVLEEAEIMERGYENLVDNLQSVGAHIRAL
jgi:UDP-N-acetylglucosamine 1-carboxyvinyltransferase